MFLNHAQENSKIRLENNLEDTFQSGYKLNCDQLVAIYASQSEFTRQKPNDSISTKNWNT